MSGRSKRSTPDTARKAAWWGPLVKLQGTTRKQVKGAGAHRHGGRGRGTTGTCDSKQRQPAS